VKAMLPVFNVIWGKTYQVQTRANFFDGWNGHFHQLRLQFVIITIDYYHLLYTKNKKRYKRFDFTFQVSPNFVSDFD
jgi:hypothetical protein